MAAVMGGSALKISTAWGPAEVLRAPDGGAYEQLEACLRAAMLKYCKLDSGQEREKKLILCPPHPDME